MKFRSRKLPVGSVHRYDLCVHDLIHGKYRPCLIMGSLIMYRDRTYIYIFYIGTISVRYDRLHHGNYLSMPAPWKPLYVPSVIVPMDGYLQHGNYATLRTTCMGTVGC